MNCLPPKKNQQTKNNFKFLKFAIDIISYFKYIKPKKQYMTKKKRALMELENANN